MQAGRAGRTAALAAGAALAACAAVVWSTPGDSYWIVDCGNKALVAQRLLDSSYADASFDYPAARFDPEQRFFPIPVPFVLERGSLRVSVFGPAYAALAAPGLGAHRPQVSGFPGRLARHAVSWRPSPWSPTASSAGWPRSCPAATSNKRVIEVR